MEVEVDRDGTSGKKGQSQINGLPINTNLTGSSTRISLIFYTNHISHSRTRFSKAIIQIQP